MRSRLVADGVARVDEFGLGIEVTQLNASL